MEERRIPAVDAHRGEVTVTLRFTRREPWRVEVVTPSGSVVSGASSADRFHALLDVRRQLEPLGLQLCCNGARLDVWPSGMVGQMSGGRNAYLRPVGRAPDGRDLVDVFDPAPCDRVGTVEAQRAALDRWIGRRRDRP
jgi:hypothetical protein